MTHIVQKETPIDTSRIELLQGRAISISATDILTYFFVLLNLYSIQTRQNPKK